MRWGEQNPGKLQLEREQWIFVAMVQSEDVVLESRKQACCM